MEQKITKIERTDADVDNSRYVIIYYEKIVDAEETVHYIAHKKEVPCTEYDKEIQDKQKALQIQIAELEDKIKLQLKIDGLKSDLLKVQAVSTQETK